MIRLVAVDIDGTLTFKDRRLDTMALEAIRKTESAGIPVILATGNVLAHAEAAAVLLGASGHLIAEDGGVVFDSSTGQEYVLGGRVEVDHALATLERAFGPLEQTRSSAARLTGITLKCTVPVEDFNKVLQDAGSPIIAVDSGFAIHLRSPDVNKGNALRKVSSITKVPMAEIAAIGDGPNDVEMLQAAGISFAVANSVEEVKRASAHVTNSPYGKGVAEAIDKILSIHS